MKQQDWIDYFEAVNGRSPEVHEVEAARLAGEFRDELPSQPPVAETIAPVSPQESQPIVETESSAQEIPQPQASTAAQSYVAQERPEETAPFQTAQQPTQHYYQQQVPPTGNPQAYHQNQQQFQQGHPNQQVYTVQVAVPSAFALFWKQFLTWLKAAWKKPSQDIPTHPYNGVAVYGLLVLLASLISTMPLIKNQMLTFSGFLAVLIAYAFIFFASILGGLAAKRLVYKDATFTFGYSFEWFGRLFSPNLLLMSGALLFSLINVYTLSNLLLYVSFVLIMASLGYTLFHKVNHSNMDMFYKYIMASALFGLIFTICMLIGLSIAGEMLFRSFMGEIGGLFSPYGGNPFGY